MVRYHLAIIKVIMILVFSPSLYTYVSLTTYLFVLCTETVVFVSAA